MKNRSFFLYAGLLFAFVLVLSGLFLWRNAQSDLRVEVSRPAVEPTLPAGTEPSFPVNLNTATKEALESLPGIGPVLAERILRYREEHGAFSSVEALCEVEGIGEKRLEEILDYISVEDET